MSEPLVRISALKKSFGANRVLDGVDMEVRKGEAVVIIGASGSGKTTLLRCINLLEQYDEGSIKVDGVEVGFRDGNGAARRRRGERELAKIRADLGMVFQLFNLFPHLSALENVMLGLRKVRGMAKDEARSLAEQWLVRVGLADKLHSLPIQLSGGQQQRVGIARAVAMGPKVLLLDEITSALDPQLVSEVLNLVRSLTEVGMTMIIATHEMSFAREVSDKVCFLDAGVICEQGPPDQIFSSPNEPRTREFLKRIIEAGRM